MLSQDSYKRLLIERRPDGVAIVTLNRPEKMNAIDNQMHHELMTFSRDFQNDPEMRALVLAGQGRAFCAGGDFSADTAIEFPSTDEAHRIVDNILLCDKPIIAAVQGYALGLGANVALLCDVVVAGPEAQFGDTHVKMGIGAGDGGQLIWPLLIGVNRAKYYLMTGDMINGKQAAEMGLASFCTDTTEEVLPKAIAIAEKLAAGPPLAITASKAAINAYMRSIAATTMPISLQAEVLTAHSKDHKEAVAAFQGKRIPKFTGR